MAQSCDRIVSGLRALDLRVDVVHLTKKRRRSDSGNKHTGFDLCWPLGEQAEHELNLLWNRLENDKEVYCAVIAFGAHYALLSARNFSAWLGLPLVTLVRGNDFDSSVFDLRRWHLVSEVYRASKKVLCVSQDKVKKIRALLPHVDVEWVANGINLKHWRKTPSLERKACAIRNTFPPDRKTIGLIGELKAKKGGLFFLETLKRSSLSDSFHLLLVGYMEPALKEYLEENQQHFSFTSIEFVDRQMLISYYLACDCLCIPSFYDGMPNVLLEGGGLGMPILASKVSGMADVLTHQESALLFEPGNTYDLHRQLDYIVTARVEDLTRLGHTLQAMIANHYTQSAEALAYHEAICSVSH